MTRRHSLRLALLGLAALALVVSTGSFSATEADTGLEIGVTSDSQAALGVERNDPSLRQGVTRTVTLMTLTNRFPTAFDDVDVTVTARNAPPSVPGSAVTAPNSLHPGESGSVTATVVCGPARTGSFQVAITASGPATTVSLERQVRVTCREEPNRGTARSDEQP